MLSPEEAKKQLKQFENPNGYMEAGIRVSGLSSRVKEIGSGLLDGAERIHGGWTPENQARWQRAKDGCEQLSDKDRRKLFDALFPSIGHHVDSSWQMQKAGPYQAGYLRRAFRAPNSPAVTAAVRAEWLATVMRSVIPYRYDLDFLVGWTPHLRWGAEPAIGLLLAAVLNSIGSDKEKTYAGFTAILRGEQTVGRVARHLTTAMLCCSLPEAWDAMERLLLAAQRQEGLRQVVLETIDFAHPQAFIRMLRLIEREKLSRFAAVTRAVAVWFGMSPDSSEVKWIDQRIVELANNLESEALRKSRLESADGQTVYLALWSLAYFDAQAAAKTAEAALRRPEFEPRYAAARLLSQLGISSGISGLKIALADSDLRVAVEALSALSTYRFRTSDHSDLFESVAALADRSPKRKSLGSVLWEWNKLEADQGAIAAKLVALRTDQPWSRVTAYLPMMSAEGRQALMYALAAETKKLGHSTAETRQIALDLLADASNSVRAQAFKLLENAIPTPSEAVALEPLLTRKSSDLRRGVIRLLLNQTRPDGEASANRLSQSKDPMMRQAGEELLAVLQPKAVAPPSPPPKTTSVVSPRHIPIPLLQRGATPRILRALDALVASNREVRVTFKTGATGKFDDLLGNVRYMSVSPDCDMPLKETWRNWWNTRPSELRDPDGLELPRAASAILLRSSNRQQTWRDKAVSHLKPDVELQFSLLDLSILQWLLLTEVPNGAATCLLDVLESMLHGVSEHHEPAPTTEYSFQEWQSGSPFSAILRLVHLLRWHHPGIWTVDEWSRYWKLLCWLDRGLPSKSRHRPALETALEAHRLGVASDDDLTDRLVGGSSNGSLRLYDYSDFSRLTRRKRDKLFDEYPALHSFIEDCKTKALEMELQRGDLPTPMSGVALAMKSLSQLGLTLRILSVLGRDKFARGYIYDAASKTSVHSHLLRISLPAEGETFDTFRQQAAELEIADSRLVDLAIYAPQWAPFVERATGISGLETVAFWLHAHTKDQYWEVDQQIRELWFAEVSERTPLSKQDLLDGAVDVEWFRQMYAAVGTGVWKVVLESAKYASSSGGHKRAELFGAALLGEIDAVELTKRIQEKRHQDSVRALGLVPLKKGSKVSRKELLSRYETLQQFIKSSRQFGSQRQASEKLAADIGLANLARTAGYPDPQRLSWAMEAEALGDLRRGPVEVKEGGVRVTLSIDNEGEASLVAEKNGKELKEIPAGLRKVPSVAAMRARKSQLGQQTSRMRRSLEESMIRGDIFTTAELREMAEHPLLRPMLNALIFVTSDAGFFHGDVIADSKESARIAHPTDLLGSGKWQQEQQACLTNSIRQPFKQAFRELYILTEAERRQKDKSSRYAGQQVNPAQALATVGKRGWVNVPEEGLRRTFHHQGISAWVTFLNGWFTPTDVDGLTVEHVLFTRRDDGKIVELDQVDPRVFSEVMRDLDLMVSVAHRGGVDPEASESTTEMRAALIRETVSLLKIENVRLSERHALVDGTLGSYNIHLGSGVVHRQPGGSLCIIPVHSQQRGRIFLPFADDDSKSAEIISKVLLLSKDNAIQDPTILEQLR